MFLIHITNPKSFVFNFWGSLQNDTLSRDEKQVLLYQIDILIIGFLAFYCNLKVTGIVNFTRTESPFCIPAVQLGMLRMTRIASTSNN